MALMLLRCVGLYILFCTYFLPSSLEGNVWITCLVIGFSIPHWLGLFLHPYHFFPVRDVDVFLSRFFS